VHDARDRLLVAAGARFYEDGFLATGIDRVLADAGVAKATLYRHFPTKDDLIVAYLERSHDAFASMLADAESEPHPRRQLERLLELVGARAVQRSCSGCTFQVAAAEYPDPRHPVHRAARRHKDAVRAWLRTRAEEAGAKDPDALADGLHLLIDGAWASARMYGSNGPAAAVAATGRTVLAAHLGTRRGPARRR
jgi:AcrR family transcriptional regulator